MSPLVVINIGTPTNDRWAEVLAKLTQIADTAERIARELQQQNTATHVVLTHGAITKQGDEHGR